MNEITTKHKEVLDRLPDTRRSIADDLGISLRACRYRMEKLEEQGYEFERDSDGVWYDVTNEESQEKQIIDEVRDVEVVEEADVSNLTTREEYILGELETGATIRELSSDLGIRPSVVKQNLKEIKRRGWEIYHDETADRIAIESDNPIRSSEHKGTRTRKANRWWELNHNQLVKEFRGLDSPDTTIESRSGNEDWVTHMTDLHAGDIVRADDGSVLYETDMIPDIIDYITEQSLYLSQRRKTDYDTSHLLWGGDFVTNEAVYEGQFEDLDAWLDEQHEVLIDPLIRQVKRFSEEFDTVQVVCQVGNHGQHRASGTSKQANADLIVYKTVRNTIAQIREHSDLLDNVNFVIGEAKLYRNFDLRGGELKGHLRHGQKRKPQAETSARENQWRGTLIDHGFDVCFMGHHHISGRIPWDGPPIISSPSPKPAGDFVEGIGGRVSEKHKDIATVHGVSDEGITGIYPVDMRRFNG